MKTLEQLESELKYLQESFLNWQNRVIEYRKKAVKEKKTLSDKIEVFNEGLIDAGLDKLRVGYVKEALKELIEALTHKRDQRKETMEAIAKSIFGERLV